MSRASWLAYTGIVGGLCFGAGPTAQEPGADIRARLLATAPGTEISLEMSNGQVWKGDLTDVTEVGIRLLAEPDKELRKRMRLPAGARLKKTLPFDEVASVEGAVSSGLVAKYLVLQRREEEPMRVLLALAAAEGFRLLAGAGRSTVILERTTSEESIEYIALSDLGEKREETLKEFGRNGFRLLPNTVGAWFGEASAILARASGDTRPIEYRVLETRREDTLAKEFHEAVEQGFRVVGLTNPGQHLIVLERQGAVLMPQETPQYRILRDFDTADLNGAATDGYRLLTCSDGERLCVMEKTDASDAEKPYEFVSAARLSTFEDELNEAGRRGYRIHRRSMGVQEAAIREVYAVMERTRETSSFEYHIVSATRGPEILSDVASVALEGFEVAAVTSETKTGSGLGVYDLVYIGLALLPRTPLRHVPAVPVGRGNVPFAKATDVFVVMERPIP